MEQEYIDINGHMVDAEIVDLFLDGKTGQPISDEEWDVQKGRLNENNDRFLPPKEVLDGLPSIME